MDGETVLHTFAVPVYGDSPYLDDCLASLKRQSRQSVIYLATATPSAYIESIAAKHGVPVYVRDGEPSIAADWEFAASRCKTKFLTLAHQDDVYSERYTETLLQKAGDASITFCDYSELGENGVRGDNRNLKIKRFLLGFIKNRRHAESTFWKRFALQFGNPICCPAVMFNTDYFKNGYFNTALKNNLDWELWLRLAKQPAAFSYVPEVLMFHRIHDGSETTRQISTSGRSEEDEQMFTLLWGKPVGKIISFAYKLSYKSNNSKGEGL